MTYFRSDHFCGGRSVEKPDHRHRRLLRPRRNRPCHRTTEKSDEFASLHVRPPSAGACILSSQTSTLIGAETGIKTTAAVHGNCRCWVISRHLRTVLNDHAASCLRPPASAHLCSSAVVLCRLPSHADKRSAAGGYIKCALEFFALS